MSAKEKQLRRITIDYSDGEIDLGIREIMGYVELHLHELDGSQTIVIRTEPRESVQSFLTDEFLTGEPVPHGN